MKLLNNLTIFIVVICSVISIFLYGGIVRRLKIKDPLEKEFNCIGCDGWAFTHFLLFFFLGYVDPNRYITYSVIGIVWECIETILGQNDIRVSGKRVMLVGEGTEKDGKIEYSHNSWWYGRVTDVAFDICGYILGSYLNVYLYGCECPKF